VIWAPGLAVAVGAAIATAHGLYEVAGAARVPAVIAWLYPLITDGLALVAYAATARLHGRAARYAWSVVVLAAGLSGLAQAAYLAAEPPVAGGSAVAAPAMLRFGIGAWPAVAAAIVAHLLYLLATAPATPATDAEAPDPEAAIPAAVTTGRAAAEATRGPATPLAGISSGDPHGEVVPVPSRAVQPDPFTTAGIRPDPTAVQSFTGPSVQSGPTLGVQRLTPPAAPAVRPVPSAAPAEQQDRRSGPSPARDRARAAATRHGARHGHLPTVSELEAAAEVSRGTAAAVLKHLRDHPTPLHLITSAAQLANHDDDPTVEERTQP